MVFQIKMNQIQMAKFSFLENILLGIFFAQLKYRTGTEHFLKKYSMYSCTSCRQNNCF